MTADSRLRRHGFQSLIPEFRGEESEIMPFESSHFSNHAYLVHSHFDYRSSIFTFLELYQLTGTLGIFSSNAK